jgi:hypothetical protein
VTHQEREELTAQRDAAIADRDLLVAELRTHQGVCQDVGEMLGYVVGDGSLQANPPPVPGTLPSSEELTDLLNQLREVCAKEAEYTRLLQQA